MAQDKDGSVKIEISADQMQAVCYISPPDLDGKPVEVVDVKKALREAGVVHGIVNNERIQAFVEEAKMTPVDFLAAAGTPPGHGEDASIVYSWEKGDTKSSDNEDEKVDLRELNIVKSVKEGEVIAKKNLPTRGEEGISVTGEKTPGEWGTDIALKPGVNVCVSEDGAEFMATSDGSPKVAGNIISVDPVFTVNGDVDYSTGNINFAGALDIKGNIQDGFLVKAEGNITIGGNVQAAEVSSGGDVIVKGGIITRNEGVVAAKGSVFAKFIENSVVEAEKDVMAGRAIINSSIRCNGRVICTSREGKIMGGDIMAHHEIRARHLGTDKEARTVLRAGFNYDVYLKMAEVEKRLEKVALEMNGIQKSLTSTKTGKAELIAELKKNLKKLETDKMHLQRRIAQLRMQSQVNPLATVKGEQFIHPGCFIYIGGSTEKVTKPLKFATLMADKEGGIALSSYDEMSRSVTTKSVGTKEKKKKILVVDDAKFMRNKLKNILSNCNFHVVGEAEDGKQAAQLFAKLKPDVVTMDITMPNVDGITSLKAIKKINPDARVVMISALGQKDKITDSIVAGAMDFIIKPFVPDKVVEVLTRVANK